MIAPFAHFTKKRARFTPFHVSFQQFRIVIFPRPVKGDERALLPGGGCLPGFSALK